MARYKPILMEKIHRAEAEEKKQRELKEELGIIPDDTIIIKKKGISDYLLSVLKGFGYLIYVILVFLGIVTVINPVSRDLLLKMLGLI